GYMAPEYLLGQPVDVRVDIFALGVVLYSALTGSKPFNGATDALVSRAVLHDEPTAPRVLNSEIPPALEEVTLRALRKSPEERWQTVREMRKALEQSIARPAEMEAVADALNELWPSHDPERSIAQRLAQPAAAPSRTVTNTVGEKSARVGWL